jgi:hypothetical protein
VPKVDLTTYIDHCEQIFVAAVETYEVLAVPSFENILALVMGVSTTTSLAGLCDGSKELTEL